MAYKRFEKFIHVNPRGAFFPSTLPNDHPQRATRINLTSLGFSEGDYVGLMREGALSYKRGDPDNIASLWVKPGTQNPIELDSEQKLLQLSSLNCAFCPKDSFYADNTDPNNDYGVVVSFPNTKPPGYRSLQDSEIVSMKFEDEFSDELSPIAVLAGILEEDQTIEEMSDPYKEILTDPVGGPRPMQYRGWYMRNNWMPSWSKYNAQRPDGTHRGIDVFAPHGTGIITPISGTFYPNPFNGGASNPTFGVTAVVKYRVGREMRYLIFAHLSSVRGRSGSSITRGQMVGAAGCSGNAGAPNPCDAANRNDYGGRSDHVHIEIRIGGLDVGRQKVDPVAEFGWQLK